jgi:uncharacterized metal-binding protein
MDQKITSGVQNTKRGQLEHKRKLKRSTKKTKLRKILKGSKKLKWRTIKISFGAQTKTQVEYKESGV